METASCLRGGSRQRYDAETCIISRPHGFNNGGEREYPNIRDSAVQNELLVENMADGAELPVAIKGDLLTRRNPRRQFGLDEDNMFALRGAVCHGILDKCRIRRLTPKECERLQGFPDDWTKRGVDEEGNITEVSDPQRYHCLGNAVTVNVIQEIAKRLMNQTNI